MDSPLPSDDDSTSRVQPPNQEAPSEISSPLPRDADDPSSGDESRRALLPLPGSMSRQGTSTDTLRRPYYTPVSACHSSEPMAMMDDAMTRGTSFAAQAMTRSLSTPGGLAGVGSMSGRAASIQSGLERRCVTSASSSDASSIERYPDLGGNSNALAFSLTQQAGSSAEEPQRAVTDDTNAKSTSTPVPLVVPLARSDPRDLIISLILEGARGGVSTQEIEEALCWAQNYEQVHGPLAEYLQSYHSIFVLSPLDDTVTLGRAMLLHPAVSRGRLATTAGAAGKQSMRSMSNNRRGGSVRPPPAAASSSRPPIRGQLVPTRYSASGHIGSISYCCVAEAFDLEQLEPVYRRRGYVVSTTFDVLHVSGPVEGAFDLYIFPSGAVIWWGMDRRDHWLIEEDFLSMETALRTGVRGRYEQDNIDELYPIWCTYETDLLYGPAMEQGVVVGSAFGYRTEVVDAALVRFAKLLHHDHYLIPHATLAREQVMLTISYCLARSARMEYYECVTQSSHCLVLGIPVDFTGLVDYFSTKRKIDKLSGELHISMLAVKTLKDTPEFLWEMPWLSTYYELTDAQHASDHRLSWFASRSDALLKQLAMVKDRRFRLFMLGSDVFLIALLVIDVVFMTLRLIVKLYFKMDD